MKATITLEVRDGDDDVRAAIDFIASSFDIDISGQESKRKNDPWTLLFFLCVEAKVIFRLSYDQGEPVITLSDIPTLPVSPQVDGKIAKTERAPVVLEEEQPPVIPEAVVEKPKAKAKSTTEVEDELDFLNQLPPGDDDFPL